MIFSDDGLISLVPRLPDLFFFPASEKGVRGLGTRLMVGISADYSLSISMTKG